MFNKNAVLKNFAIFTEKHLRWSLFLNKNVDLQSWNFIKKRLQRRFFSCGYCKIFKNTWFGEHLWTASNITRNMEIEKDIFSKTKQNKKKKIKNLAKWKNLTFSWCSWSFRFSLYLHCMPQAVVALHNKRWS